MLPCVRPWFYPFCYNLTSTNSQDETWIYWNSLRMAVSIVVRTPAVVTSNNNSSSAWNLMWTGKNQLCPSNWFPSASVVWYSLYVSLIILFKTNFPWAQITIYHNPGWPIDNLSLLDLNSHMNNWSNWSINLVLALITICMHTRIFTHAHASHAHLPFDILWWDTIMIIVWWTLLGKYSWKVFPRWVNCLIVCLKSYGRAIHKDDVHWLLWSTCPKRIVYRSCNFDTCQLFFCLWKWLARIMHLVVVKRMVFQQQNKWDHLMR